LSSALLTDTLVQPSIFLSIVFHVENIALQKEQKD